ncbi:MAG: heparinase II/III family protein, partial [Clostridia bacterium]|nr:heparinase II/III family protein [Clostridia bacterium]
RIVDPYLKDQPRWGRNNWSSVCAHGVVTTFIYLGLDEEFEKARPALLRSLEDFLSSYKEDGYCTEGALYWSYGFESFVYAASLLREYTKGELDYFRREKVRAIARYGFSTFFEGNLTLPFADSPHRLNYNIGLYHFLKKEYPELPLPDEAHAAMFGDEARCRFFEMMRNLYWFDETLAGGDRVGMSCDFPVSQVFLRSKKNYHFASKGGHNGESHNHNDVGSFIVIAGGEYVLDDPGWPEYDRWYFSEKRYTDYVCAMSEGHSLPIINGEGQKPGEERAGKLISLEEDRIAIDLSGAYGAEGVGILRTWILHDDGVEIRDTVTGAETVTERFVTRLEPAIREDGTVRIADSILSSASGTPEITSRTFVPRLVSNIGMKPVETLWLIDFPASCGENVFRLTVKER